ncbi:hypothetical protein ACFL2K_03980, partial [Candidatus Margulisiibacteriota bacterium]
MLPKLNNNQQPFIPHQPMMQQMMHPMMYQMMMFQQWMQSMNQNPQMAFQMMNDGRYWSNNNQQVRQQPFYASPPRIPNYKDQLKQEILVPLLNRGDISINGEKHKIYENALTKADLYLHQKDLPKKLQDLMKVFEWTKDDSKLQAKIYIRIITALRANKLGYLPRTFHLPKLFLHLNEHKHKNINDHLGPNIQTIEDILNKNSVKIKDTHEREFNYVVFKTRDLHAKRIHSFGSKEIFNFRNYKENIDPELRTPRANAYVLKALKQDIKNIYTPVSIIARPAEVLKDIFDECAALIENPDETDGFRVFRDKEQENYFMALMDIVMDVLRRNKNIPLILDKESLFLREDKNKYMYLSILKNYALPKLLQNYKAYGLFGSPFNVDKSDPLNNITIITQENYDELNDLVKKLQKVDVFVLEKAPKKEVKKPSTYVDAIIPELEVKYVSVKQKEKIKHKNLLDLSNQDLLSFISEENDKLLNLKKEQVKSPYEYEPLLLQKYNLLLDLRAIVKKKMVKVTNSFNGYTIDTYLDRVEKEYKIFNSLLISGYSDKVNHSNEVLRNFSKRFQEYCKRMKANLANNFYSDEDKVQQDQLIQEAIVRDDLGEDSARRFKEKMYRDNDIRKNGKYEKNYLDLFGPDAERAYKAGIRGDNKLKVIHFASLLANALPTLLKSSSKKNRQSAKIYRKKNEIKKENPNDPMLYDRKALNQEVQDELDYEKLIYGGDNRKIYKEDYKKKEIRSNNKKLWLENYLDVFNKEIRNVTHFSLRGKTRFGLGKKSKEDWLINTP